MGFLELVSIIVVLAAAISGLALIRGDNRWNRLLGYNIVSGKVTIAIVLLAAISGNDFYLDIAIIYTLLSFIGVTALSDYLVDKGQAARELADAELVEDVAVYGPEGGEVSDAVE